MKTDEQFLQSQIIGYQREKSNNAYSKEWIDKSVEEGSIRCYSESDITIGHIPIAGGAYGVVYKATMKRNKMAVAIKTLFPDVHGREEKFYRKFVKEVVYSRSFLILLATCIQVYYTTTIYIIIDNYS